ncbi:hypothetical protein BY458DRAFT_553105 [Sporodiniella umbellata]|nr:hypothetical protein BY458DRAFT_553105 [Sporodiniella umbellata]
MKSDQRLSEQREGKEEGFPEMEAMLRHMKGTSKASTVPVLKREPNRLQVDANIGPREQEAQGKRMDPERRGCIVGESSPSDPLYANQLGILWSIQAMMTENSEDYQQAVDTFAIAIRLAEGQIQKKNPARSSLVSRCLSGWVGSSSTGLPMPLHASPTLAYTQPEFLDNLTLRAYTLRAESGLFSVLLRWWQGGKQASLQKEYKKMGQRFTKYMDRHTVAALHLGLGILHLFLFFYPEKKPIGFQPQSSLGIALIQLSIETQHCRSSFASLILLCYYNRVCHWVPFLLETVYEPMVHCLRHAQAKYPQSVLFLSMGTQWTPARKVSWGGPSESVLVSRWAGAMALAYRLDWGGCIASLKEPRTWREGYLVGACYWMQGETAQAVLIWATLVPAQGQSALDRYLERTLARFRSHGYQHLYCLPVLELFLVTHHLPHLAPAALQQTLQLVSHQLTAIQTQWAKEIKVRHYRLTPPVALPDYDEPKLILYLIQITALNALQRAQESIEPMNWLMAHRDRSGPVWRPWIEWEAGMTYWSLGDKKRARERWQICADGPKDGFENQWQFQLKMVSL